MSKKSQNRLTIVEIYQRAIREWAGALTPYELALAMHLLDRTVGWGKTRVTISTRRFLNGDTVYSGLDMSRPTMFRALRSLEDKGLIVRHNDPRGREIKVYAVNLGWKPDTLPTPNLHKNQSHRETTPSLTETTQSHRETREKEEGRTEEGRKKNNTEAPEPSAPDPGPNSSRTPDEIIRAAGETFRAARTRRAQPQGNSLKAKVAHAEALWRDAIAENHPTALAQKWSMREVGMVKAKAKDWPSIRQISFADFVEWCAANWAQIMHKQFKWMTKSPPPDVPSVGFLISFLDQFADCWGDDSFKQWLNSTERTEMDKLLSKGRTSDEAAAEIGERRAVEKMRDENRKAKQDIAIKRGALKLQENRVRRMEHMPAHPQSKEAVAARRRKVLGDDFKALDPEKPTEQVDWDNVPLLDPNWEPPDEKNLSP